MQMHVHGMAARSSAERRERLANGFSGSGSHIMGLSNKVQRRLHGSAAAALLRSASLECCEGGAGMRIRSLVQRVDSRTSWVSAREIIAAPRRCARGPLCALD